MTSKKAYLITGTSRGLGHALACAAFTAGARVVGIARHDAPDLTLAAAEAGAEYRFVALDLFNAGTTAKLADDLAPLFAEQAWDSLYLINNAATTHPIALAELSQNGEVIDAVSLNLTAAILLTGAFIRASEGRAADRRVLNISSGAGRSPLAGSSVYCATKAGLDHYTRCLGLEQSTRENGVRSASIAPGVIDTDMQAEMRSASAVDLPQRQMFVDYFESGQLASPGATATKLLAYLHGDRIGFGDIVSIRDLP